MWDKFYNWFWESLPHRIAQFLWSFRPDNCEVEGCCRKGALGNENVIDGVIVCDYCHMKTMTANKRPTNNGDGNV
ncbi:MAG: hypothetical protein COB09_16930 [Thalassobium sp.]|nr:MAG: hypothetical protein COB09_16930 [Thalassobium sp.]